jgi:hypothetical protein
MRIKHIISFLAFGIISIITTQPAFSHSGRTDSSGCHTNRKTGEYHCHSKKSKITKQRSKTSINVQRPNVIYGEGPYKWKDENGGNIDIDINKVPERIRERFQKK